MVDDKEFPNIDQNKIKSFQTVTKFHGHVCPGSAIGYQAAKIGLKELSSNGAADEELVCIVENDSCAVDAIQVVAGCTFGKGNLIFQDHGKQVYTFMNRDTGDAVRISLRSSFDPSKINPRLSELRNKVAAGGASSKEKDELEKLIGEASQKVLQIPEEEMFKVEHLKMELPPKAHIFKSLKCVECGEMVSEHRAQKLDDEYFCIPCFELNKK